MNNLSTQNSAVIFFTKPQIVEDSVLRSHRFQFTDELANNITMSLEKTANQKLAIADVVRSTVGLNAIAPSTNYTKLKTSVLGDFWSFTLVVDQNLNDNNDNLQRIKAFSQFRYVYIGYCNTEPVNPHTRTINPQCKLLINRKVVINKIQNRVSANETHDIYNTKLDLLVVSHDSRIVSDELFAISPENIVNSTEIGMDNKVIPLVDDSKALSVIDNVPILSSVASPKNQLSSIIGSIYDGLSEAVHDDYLCDTANFDDDNCASAIITANIHQDIMHSNNSVAANSSDLFGLIPTNDYLLQSVITKFNPNIHILENLPFDCSVIPQRITSIETVFSSLISAIIPGVLSTAGIGDASFTYDSSSDVFELFDFKSISPISQEALSKKWESVQFQFKTDLARVIYNNGGDFHVMIQISLAGDTFIKLIFLDQCRTFSNNDYYKHNNLINTNSPLLGTYSQLQENSTQLNKLIKIAGDNFLYSRTF